MSRRGIIKTGPRWQPQSTLIKPRPVGVRCWAQTRSSGVNGPPGGLPFIHPTEGANHLLHEGFVLVHHDVAPHVLPPRLQGRNGTFTSGNFGATLLAFVKVRSHGQEDELGLPRNTTTLGWSCNRNFRPLLGAAAHCTSTSFHTCESSA